MTDSRIPLRSAAQNLRRASLLAFSLVLVGTLLAPAHSARAQARPSPATQVVSVDILPLAYSSTLTFQYEYKVDPVTSWLLRAHVWPSPATNWSGYGLGAAYRFYIADSRALTALSVAPAADIYFMHETLFGTSQRSAITFAVGADLAYKWIFQQFAVEPILGLRFGFGPQDAPSSAETIQPLLGVSLGYAWQ